MKLFLIILIVCFACGCSTPAAKTERERLPDVHLDLNGWFILPECEGYSDISPQRLLVLPTVQEARLSGFVPAAGCSDALVDARLAKERILFGDIAPTPEMERRKEQLLLRRQMRRIEQRQDDIRNEQEEMKRKLEGS